MRKGVVSLASNNKESHCKMIGKSAPRKASASNGMPKSKPGKGAKLSGKSPAKQY
jgi:hypothetical protein